ncbi:MAG: cytidylate kinase [Spirochaetaceae bacterium]|nr:MAG: cytidylate kinase [Spirochaetaceae bacterium]
MSSKGNGELRIAVSGKSGCGNSTVSRIVAESLGLRLVNYTFHSIADERGIPFEEVCRLAEEDSSWDRHLDRRQIELAMEQPCVLGSRLAVWLLHSATLKVYLTASIEERARRIQEREGGALDEVLQKTLDRDRKDRERYMRLYNIDNNEFGFVDLIINTEHHNQDEVANLIIAEVSDTNV